MGLPNIFAKIFLQDVKFLRIFSRNVLFAANPSYNQINQLFRFGFDLMNRNLLLFVAININIYILNFIDVFCQNLNIFSCQKLRTCVFQITLLSKIISIEKQRKLKNKYWSRHLSISEQNVIYVLLLNVLILAFLRILQKF